MSFDDSRISEVLPQRERLPATRISTAIEAFFDAISQALGWLWLLLMLVVVANVVMRYFFGEGRVEFEEIQWHIYAVGFLLGLSVCMSSNHHIRVDIFHGRLSVRMRAWVELYGLLLLFFPFVIFIFFHAIGFVEYSFATSEISDSPGGLRFRWAIKAVLPLAMLLLIIAGIGRLLRVSSCLFGVPVATSRADRQ